MNISLSYIFNLVINAQHRKLDTILLCKGFLCLESMIMNDTRHNISSPQGSILPPLFASYATVPFVHLGLAGSGMMTLASILAFQWKSRAWRRQVGGRGHLCKRILVLTLCGELHSY